VPAIFSLSYDQQIFNPPLKGDQRAAEQAGRGDSGFSMEGVRDTVMVRAALEYLELAKVRHAQELMRGRTSEWRDVFLIRCGSAPAAGTRAAH